MKSQYIKPRGWTCECGNILGVMYRNSNRIMVLDTFRIPVMIGQLQIVMETASPTDYSMHRVMRGNVICVNCGRSKVWDATELLYKRKLKKRMPNL